MAPSGPPIQYDSCPCKKMACEDADAGRWHVTVGAEVRGTRPPAKEGRGLQADLPELGRGKKEPLQALEGAQPCDTPMLASRSERIHFCCFKRPDGWYSATAAPGNEDTVLEQTAPGLQRRCRRRCQVTLWDRKSPLSDSGQLPSLPLPFRVWPCCWGC